MGEIIQIHVGQAGVQIGNACWELYCLEHGVKVDGSLCDCPCDNTFKNFFSFKDANRVVPRTVMVDSEPTVIDQIRTGPYGCLYNPASLISGKEDSGSNFARGYYTIGAELIDITMESIRTVAESCCNLRGFLVFRSVGGGTGSGLGNLIAEQLKDEYDRISKVEFVIFPSPSISPLIVEPYNALLATHLGMDSIECTFILDNEALYDICAAKLNICSPRYKNLNRIIGQIASTFTTSQRFASDSSMTFAEFQTNLVPYPRIHFPVVSYAPFIAGTGLGYTNLTTEQITSACFEPCSQLVRCNPADGKYMSCVLLYRGQVQASFINSSICHLRSSGTIRFVDWQPTGFKIQLNTEPPFTVPCGGLSNSNKALLTLSNNTIIQKAWCRLMSKFNRLYSRKAFIHHYLEEGLEEDIFKEASEDICTLIYDYQEVDKAGAGDVNGRKQPFLIPYEQCPDFNECGTRSLRRSKCGSVDQTVNQRSNRNSNDDKQADRPWPGKSNQNVKGTESCSEIMPGLSSLNFFFGDGTEQGNTCKCECEFKPTPTPTPTPATPYPTTKGGTPQTQTMSSSKKKPNRESRKVSNKEPEVIANEKNKAPRLPTRSQSNQSVAESKGHKTTGGSQRRSKSYEPNSTSAGMSSSTARPINYTNFDQGFDSEACRAKARFCQCFLKCARDCCSRTCPETCEKPVCGPACGGKCNPGEVLLLPPPRREGKEILSEALSAKERFCNSVCKPKCCKTNECEDPCCCCPIADPCLDPCPKQSCCFARDPCIAPFCCFESKLPCKTPCNDPCCSPKLCCEDPCCVKTCCYDECEIPKPPCCSPKVCCEDPCCVKTCCYDECEIPKPPCSTDPCCSTKVCREDPCCVKTCCYDECEIPKPPCCQKSDCEDVCCSDLIMPYRCARVCGFSTIESCVEFKEEKPCCSPCRAPCRSPSCSSCRRPCSPCRSQCSPCRQPCSPCRPLCSPFCEVCSPCSPCSPCDDTCPPCRDPCATCRVPCSPCRDTCSPCRDPCSPCRETCSPCRDTCSPCRDTCSPCRDRCSPCRDTCSPCRDPCSPCGDTCSPCRETCSPCRDTCSPCRDLCSPCRDTCSPCCNPCISPCCREDLLIENLVKAENYCPCPMDLCPDPCCYNEANPCCVQTCPCEDPCCTTLVKPCCECEEPKSPCCSPCNPPCNSPCCSPRTCCDNLVYPSCYNNECCCPQEIKWVVRPPKRRRIQSRQKCFCCLDTDDIMYCNSDYRLPPMCCRPHRRQRQQHQRCFCNDEICGIFNASSAILVAPRCCSSFCYCVQEEEVAWCPNDDRVCECFPESRTVFRPRVSREEQNDEDDPRVKPRFPGPVGNE